jgi:hypothetical protein
LNSLALKCDHLIRKISAAEALVECEKAISCVREKGTELQEIFALGFKGEAQLMLGDAEGSLKTISMAREIYDKQSLVMALWAAPYLVARFSVSINQLQQKICSKTPSNVPSIRKKAYLAGKAALRNSRNYAPYRTKIFRLMGLYYWLIGEQGKALKWWNRTIQEGERLGARPDLSRTYFEVGKRLLEPDIQYRELNGISAKEYLEKSEKLFREMDLEWDLEQLERVRSVRKS